jgi:hypothetical protein
MSRMRNFLRNASVAMLATFATPSLAATGKTCIGDQLATEQRAAIAAALRDNADLPTEFRAIIASCRATHAWNDAAEYEAGRITLNAIMMVQRAQASRFTADEIRRIDAALAALPLDLLQRIKDSGGDPAPADRMQVIPALVGSGVLLDQEDAPFFAQYLPLVATARLAEAAFDAA